MSLESIWVKRESEKKVVGWSKEDEDYLIGKYYDTPIDVISEYLGRDPRSIYMKAYRLRLKGRQANRYSIWSEDQEQYMKDFYGTMNNSVIAKKLNKSRRAVEVKAQRIGLANERI